MIEKKIEFKMGGTMQEFTPLPDDKYQVEISDVNLVTGMNQFTSQEEELLNFEFTVLDDKKFEDTDGKVTWQASTRGRKLWKRMRPTLTSGGGKGKASWLYKLICAIEGKNLKDDELIQFDPNDLIGQQVFVMVDQKPGKDGKIWNNILSFSHAKDFKDPFEKSEADEKKPAQPVRVNSEPEEEDPEWITEGIKGTDLDPAKQQTQQQEIPAVKEKYDPENTEFIQGLEADKAKKSGLQEDAGAKTANTTNVKRKPSFAK